MKYQIASDEQQAKLEACNTPEDILALAREEGYELTDEQLASVAGGGFWGDDVPVITCPACGKEFENPSHATTMSCPHCGAYLVPSYG